MSWEIGGIDADRRRVDDKHIAVFLYLFKLLPNNGIGKQEKHYLSTFLRDW